MKGGVGGVESVFFIPDLFCVALLCCHVCFSMGFVFIVTGWRASRL